VNGDGIKNAQQFTDIVEAPGQPTKVVVVLVMIPRHKTGSHAGMIYYRLQQPIMARDK